MPLRIGVTADGGGFGVGGGGFGGDGFEGGLLLEPGSDMEHTRETTSENNVELLYTYTESILKNVNANLDQATAKLTAIIAFSGVLLKFTMDLPGEGYFFSSKFLICVLTAITTGFCGAGLLSKSSGDVLKPEELIKPEWYSASPEKFRLYIIRQWIEAIAQLNVLLLETTHYLNWAIGCLVLTSIIFAGSIAISLIH
ncbi:MAG: hypothetical protein AAFV90_23550 [Cyanobacteria bacterium J06634_5]